MKLLIDGNIILDVLQKRDPHYEDSAMILKMPINTLLPIHTHPESFTDSGYFCVNVYLRVL